MTKENQVWAVTDCDWCVASTIDEAITLFCLETGMPEDELRASGNYGGFIPHDKFTHDEDGEPIETIGEYLKHASTGDTLTSEI